MPSQDPNLPSYKKPPLNEVVCGVQFVPFPGFRSTHFGRFADRLQARYPKTEDREPLADVYEGEQGPQVKDELITLQMPPLRRVFYVDPTGNYLLQLQPSRFLSNWRKQKDSDAYPRFTAAFDRFKEGWRDLLEFAKAEGIGQPQVNQYELSYINHIPESSVPFPEGMQHYLRFFSWANIRSSQVLRAPRSGTFRFQFALSGHQGTLHVTVNHGKRMTDQKGILLVDLTARGPARFDWSDIDEWFATAHATIVNGFTDMTTPEAHEIWGRER
jgi:uncharacterized protein (TIGR04255 family)